jgi:hypothetical protein
LNFGKLTWFALGLQVVKSVTFNLLGVLPLLMLPPLDLDAIRTFLPRTFAGLLLSRHIATSLHYGELRDALLMHPLEQAAKFDRIPCNMQSTELLNLIA